jgi:hypothetical protein
MNTYYVWTGERATGPFTLAQLRALWKAGSITGDMAFKYRAEEEWVGTLSDLAEKLDDNVATEQAKVRAAVKAANPKALNTKRIEEVRKSTCYSTLRAVVNVMAILYVLAGAIYAGFWLLQIDHGTFPALVCIGLAVMTIFLSIILAAAWKQGSQLLIDIADILVEGSRQR